MEVLVLAVGCEEFLAQAMGCGEQLIGTIQLSRKQRLVDLEDLEVRHDPRTQDYYYHGLNERPRNFLELCHFGCGFFSYLHTSTGRVYYVGEHRIYLQANS